MSAVVVLSAEFYEKSPQVPCVDGTKEKSFVQAFDFDLDWDSEDEEMGVKGLEDDDCDKVYLVSNDGERYEVRKKSALLCGLVEAILEGDPTTTEIPLRKVDGRVLAFAVEYLEHHCGKQPAEIPKPLRSVYMEKMVEDLWDAEFVNKRTMAELYAVILAANYMDCDSLMQLHCCKLATLIKGRNEKETREVLSDENRDNIILPLDSLTRKPSKFEQKASTTEEDTKEESTELATDRMDDSTLIDDDDVECVSDKPATSHSASESAHSEEETKEATVELSATE